MLLAWSNEVFVTIYDETPISNAAVSQNIFPAVKTLNLTCEGAVTVSDVLRFRGRISLNPTWNNQNFVERLCTGPEFVSVRRMFRASKTLKNTTDMPHFLLCVLPPPLPHLVDSLLFHHSFLGCCKRCRESFCLFVLFGQSSVQFRNVSVMPLWVDVKRAGC